MLALFILKLICTNVCLLYDTLTLYHVNASKYFSHCVSLSGHPWANCSELFILNKVISSNIGEITVLINDRQVLCFTEEQALLMQSRSLWQIECYVKQYA